VPVTALAVDPMAPAAAALRRAADVLRGGGVIVFPTETFYALGADALRPEAVARIRRLKGRPDDKPLLLLVDSIAMVESLVTTISPAARALMARHWPGPLTLVLPARALVPVEVTAGTGTVGVRLSPHAVARGLVAALGRPVTATSANLAGAPPPSTAAEALAGLGDGLDLVLDGGPTAGGPASTVVDVAADPPRVIRQGAVVP
jgi:L-threonylcarbamoyladenylate synthase